MHTTLAPVIALALWSMIMLGWMFVRRSAAMKAKGISLAGRRGGRGSDLEKVIEERVHWPSHNYTHLMEQPTVFYAVALALAVMGHGGGVSAWLAWSYVALRVVHSIVQATANVIAVRATLFMLSTLVLIAMIVRAALLLG